MNSPPFVTKSTKDDASIDAYAADIQVIWPQDQKRPILLHWLNVVAHASNLAEEIRKSAWDKVAHETAEVFVWWLSFIKRISKPPENRSDPDAIFYLPCTPSDIVWSKFPNRCPVCFGLNLSRTLHCDPASEEGWDNIDVTGHDLLETYKSLAGKNCRCLIEKELVESRSRGFKRFVKFQLDRLTRIDDVRQDKPTSLMELEESIKRIYGHAIFVLSADEIAFHLLEEIGEVSEALVNVTMQPTPNPTDFLAEHKRRLKNVREELADVFSWTMAMRARTNFILSRAAEYVKEAYKKRGEMDVIGGQVVSTMLKPTSNIVDLVWLTYNIGKDPNVLSCEDCGERPCDPKSKAHKQDAGKLYGKQVTKFFDQISSLSANDDL